MRLEEVMTALAGSEYEGIREYITERETDFDALQAEFDTFKEGAHNAECRWNEEREELTKSVNDLKTKNYDLLMQVPSYGDNTDPQTNQVDGSGEVVHIEDLFE